MVEDGLAVVTSFVMRPAGVVRFCLSFSVFPFLSFLFSFMSFFCLAISGGSPSNTAFP